jgi:two-component system nitrate/nitrite response regulator NarL
MLSASPPQRPWPALPGLENAFAGSVNGYLRSRILTARPFCLIVVPRLSQCNAKAQQQQEGIEGGCARRILGDGVAITGVGFVAPGRNGSRFKIMEARVNPQESADVVRVLVTSDARLYREGLEHILHAAAGVEVLPSASSATEAIVGVRNLEPSVVLLDMAMDESFSLARQIARISRVTRVVALGMPEVESDVLTCAEVGIASYVTRAGSASDMLEAISAAARGEVCCSPKIAGFLFRRIAALSSGGRTGNTMTGLTAREAQILRLLQQGLSNKMISRNLGIELPTVKNHVHSILGKLGVHSRAEVVSLLYRRSSNDTEGAQGA